ncbi:Hypothetical_protein [Hexamita inflata]|uniref:Hypothetical_protein n=1 Tax=Hexamita inflata TaxID=28002 RepID=A0AA86QY96_9EUKA|nr:Hypothetical protein HINF_LOCUS49479 [Hexamita inflata]
MQLLSQVFSKNIFVLLCNRNLVYTKIQSSNYQLCVNQLQFSNQILVYCERAENLVSRSYSSYISSSSSSPVHYSLNTQKVQNSALNFTFAQNFLPSFALFGFVAQISIIDSNLAVQIQNSTQSSLICLSCDLSVQTSVFLFVSNGFNVSGLVSTPVNSFLVNKTAFNCRLIAKFYSGGLILNGTETNIQINELKMNIYLEGIVKGNLMGFVSEVTITSQLMKICSNVEPAAGSGDLTLVVELDCSLCAELFYVYGLCQDQLVNGEINGRNISCTNELIFDGEKCTCEEGKILNASSCVDTIQITSLMIQNQNELELFANQIDIRIFNNITDLNNTVVNNFTTINSTMNELTSTFAQLSKTVIDQNLIIQQQQETIQSQSQFVNIFNLSTINMTVLNITAANAIIENIYTKTQIDQLIQQNISEVQSQHKPRGIGEIMTTFVYLNQTFVHQNQTYVLCNGGATEGIYPNLYSMGLTQIPNMGDTFLKGTTNSSFSNNNSFFNSNNITLTIDQMPAHNHTSRGYSSTDGYGGWEMTGEGTAFDYETSQTGGSTPIDIQPRHKLVFYYIVVD